MTLTQKGQVTIPAEIRRAMGLKAGDKVRFEFDYPLDNADDPPPHALALNDWEFDEHVPLDLVHGWLREGRARPVFELRAHWPGQDYRAASPWRSP